MDAELHLEKTHSSRELYVIRSFLERYNEVIKDYQSHSERNSDNWMFEYYGAQIDVIREMTKEVDYALDVTMRLPE